MTEPMNETRPQCRAVMSMNNDQPYRCALVENHAAMHRDMDGDTWDITYVDEPGVSPQAIPFVMNVRPVQDQLTALTARVGTLETLVKRVENLEQTSASGAATDDMFAGVNRRLDKAFLRINDLQRELLAVKENVPQVLATQMDGHQVMFDGSVREPVETVTVSDLDVLRRNSERLRALEAAGVDNWEGYGHAMSTLHGDDD